MLSWYRGFNEDGLWRLFLTVEDDGDGRDVAGAVEDAVRSRDHEPGAGDRRARADRTATDADDDLGDVVVEQMGPGEVRTVPDGSTFALERLGHGWRSGRAQGRHRGDEDRPEGNPCALTSGDTHADERPPSRGTDGPAAPKNHSSP